MKRLTFALLLPIAFFSGACEQHKPAELLQIPEQPEGARVEGTAKPGDPMRPDQAVKTAPDAPGPKFFNH